MAYRIEKSTGDIVIDGFETGIASSPHKGIANIQNANISTENGEILASFARTQQSMTATGTTGSLAFVDTNHVSLSISNSNNRFKGNWITVTGSTHTGELPNGTYYVPPSTGSNFQLANYYNAMNYTPSVTVNALVVGGGGGGGTSNTGGAAGGGGGGGVNAGSSLPVLLGAYPVVVGAGGTTGSNGADSTFSTLTGTGGGHGGSFSSQNGTAGGSGGGGGGINSSTAGTGGAGTIGQGNNGGGGATSGFAGGGGGGGAGAVGSAGSNSTGFGIGGSGGNGTSSSITGASVTYGGGGGGEASPNGANNAGFSASVGGTGGGGNGGATGGPGHGPSTAGTANTGGGGGGGTNGGGNPTGGSGIVIISYTTGTLTATGGTITTSGGNTIHTFTTSGTFTVTAITQVVVPAVLTGFTAGLTASFTLTATMGSPLAKATESYFLSGTRYTRYYVLDNQNLVWVYDTQNETLYSASDNVNWFLPDLSKTWCTKASGIAVISGFLLGACEKGLFGKSVATLGNTNTQGTTWVQVPDLMGWNGSIQSTSTLHFCFTGHQGTLSITDNNYIASIFPDSTISSLTGSSQNIQSLCSWIIPGASPTQGQFSIISGTSPVPSDSKRVPVVFFTPNTGVLPTAISAGTVYYLDNFGLSGATPGFFDAYAASTGGSPIDIQSGASGVQYFNTFYPLASASASTGSTPTYTLTPQRVTLPSGEIAQCMAEVGNTMVIGCFGNIVYPWDQASNLPSGLISLPETNVTNIITVNQMAYIFAGNGGNIYITDGSVASLVLNIPDYCAGVPGSPGTYIEPNYIWGGAMFLRGRVYFSVLDQNATKAGNCGGIWSFVPTQNLYIGQDTGIALRLEAQNSYGTYNGTAPLLVGKLEQNSTVSLYWSVWYSSVTSPTYGIDYSTTGTAATSPMVLETDAIPVGTMLSKQTFKQLEYKLSAPLDTNATVTAKYRTNITDAWTVCDAFTSDTQKLSGYAKANFQQSQWLQFQFTLTPITSIADSNTFVRLREIRLR